MIESFIPTCTDISGWNKKVSVGTGGTRKKNIYSSNENQEYFFKGSKQNDDGTFKYPLEFWSEIIASKVGQFLGFNLLDYNIGIDINNDQQVGCLSINMIDNKLNRLSEGIDYLMACDELYEPNTTEHRYTFDLIERTFKEFKLELEFPKFISMLVFDALIGNSDRHQENWGFILYNQEALDDIRKNIIKDKNWGQLLTHLFSGIFALNPSLFKPKDQYNLMKIDGNIASHVIPKAGFSPIYDSGCCLGRELIDQHIDKHIADQTKIENYYKKGKSEIRISQGKKKPTHFNLLKYVKSKHQTVFEKIQKDIRKNYDSKQINYLIENIDANLPNDFKEVILPNNRKQFMKMVLTSRTETILNI